jgi:hypothetical protein
MPAWIINQTDSLAGSLLSRVNKAVINRADSPHIGLANCGVIGTLPSRDPEDPRRTFLIDAGVRPASLARKRFILAI